jgi:ABC-type branched-subunit amino acid transport system ATPase component/branched-subunit amino acid ABC-type transport system permease component
VGTLALLGGLIVYGIVSGSVYGLAGSGITLTYAATGILNFAYPALLFASGWIFYALVDASGLPWLAGLAICTLVIGPVIGLGLARLGRALIRVHSVLQAAVMIGLLVSITGIINIITGSSPDVVSSFLPTTGVSIGGVTISVQDWVVLALGAGAVTALALWLRLTSTGLAIRAVVADQDLAELSGIRSARTQRIAWMVSCSLAMFAGVLFAPTVNLLFTPIFGIVLGAFAAAAIGSFIHLPSTFAGGLLVGVLVSITSYYAAQHSDISYLPTIVPLLILLVVMIAKSRSTVEEGGRGFVFGGTPRLSGLRVPFLGLLVLGAVVIQLLNISQLLAVTVGLAYVTIFLGINVLMRSGQVSLGQAAVAAVGAAAVVHFAATGLGLPWGVAFLLGLVIAALLGVLMAVMGARLSGIYVALATLAAGYVIETAVFPTGIMFGTIGNVAAPLIPGTALPYYVVLAVAVAATAWLVIQYRSRFGRLLAAFAEGSSGVRAFGLSTFRLRLLIFAVAGALASAGGALLSGITGTASTATFDFTMSLLWFAAVALGAGTLTGTVFPGLAVGIVPVLFPTTNQYLVVVLGAFAVIVGLVGARSYSAEKRSGEIGGPRTAGGAPALEVQREAPGAGSETPDARPDKSPAESNAALNGTKTPAHVSEYDLPREADRAVGSVLKPEGSAAGGGEEPGVLSATDIRVTYGGLIALDGVSFEAPAGRITGLIGPNGSGKSTLVGVIAGNVRAAAGDVRLDARSLTGMNADQRARLGIGRTFQGGSLYGALTVWENVVAAWECGQVGAQRWLALRTSWLLLWVGVERARDALARTGIEALWSRRAKELSTGDQRLVEVARILAGGFKVALLDESAAGLDAAARRRFSDLLVQVSAELGLTLIVVEHDLSLIEEVAEKLVVLGSGKVVRSGDTREVLNAADVRELYMALPAAASGSVTP